MASIRTILQQRTPNYQETNLEKGRVWMYANGTENAVYKTGFCWKSPGTGTAVIEVWGAGGPTGYIACCGVGTPGNAGAYSNKTIAVNASSYVCGIVGMSPVPATACFSGCGDPTQLCWVGSADNNCICTQGGFGGMSLCITGNSPYCCMYILGLCGTLSPDNCGIICNTKSGCWIASGYGGDVNCCGKIGCISLFGCYPTCRCLFQYHVPTPPGMISTNGTIVTYGSDSDNTAQSNWSGSAFSGFFTGLAIASGNPQGANPVTHCWSGTQMCGCYESMGCQSYLPTGTGGLPPAPCSNVCDVGTRGGHGAVRIRFY